MTLDEAIKHAEEVAEEKEKLANAYESFKDYGNPKSSITSGHEKCLRCAKEHRQLAEWLKELKQLREQQLCEDTISRQEAINKLTGKEFWLNYDYETLDQVITSMLNDLPPVTPQPKMGRWIRKTVKAGCFVFGCNLCGWQQLYATDFCPDCRTKMVEPQDVLDKIKAEILDEAEYAYADFDEYKEEILHAEADELPDDDFRYGLRRAVEIINKYKAESGE